MKLVDQSLAMAAAAGASEHSRSRLNKDMTRHNLNFIAAKSTLLLPSEQRESENELPDGEQDFNE